MTEEDIIGLVFKCLSMTIKAEIISGYPIITGKKEFQKELEKELKELFDDNDLSK
jgi:hypothetical protein